MCFDTGTAPAVGYSRTVFSTNVNDSALTADWSPLQGQAAAGNIELVAKGTLDGNLYGLFVPQPASSTYTSDKTGLGPFSQAQLKTKIQAGDYSDVYGGSAGLGDAHGGRSRLEW